MSNRVPSLVAIAWVFTSVTAAYSCPSGNLDLEVPIDMQVKEVVSHLVGQMDTSAQATANPKAPNVRITTCKVTVEQPTSQGVFLYQEQAMSAKLSNPYRQRFLRIAPSEDNLSVESASFKPSNLQALIGLCNQPERSRIVKLSDIGNPVCSVFLKPDGDNYVGETPAKGCPSNYKGAVRITNRIVLHSTGMDTRDTGFDAAGNQVWGAKEDPYQFRWINSSTLNNR